MIKVRKGEIKLYNEFGLQFELGFHQRNILPIRIIESNWNDRSDILPFKNIMRYLKRKLTSLYTMTKQKFH